MKYTHPDLDKVFYIQEDMWGIEVRQHDPQSPVTKLKMDRDQFANFKRRLIEGGWNEQSTQR